MTKPVGYATYASGAIVAELLGVDEWRVTIDGVENPGMARTLAVRYEGEYGGPSHGYYGQLILKDLAERMGGTYVFNMPPSGGPDTVY